MPYSELVLTAVLHTQELSHVDCQKRTLLAALHELQCHLSSRISSKEMASLKIRKLAGMPCVPRFVIVFPVQILCAAIMCSRSLGNSRVSFSAHIELCSWTPIVREVRSMKKSATGVQLSDRRVSFDAAWLLQDLLFSARACVS